MSKISSLIKSVTTFFSDLWVIKKQILFSLIAMFVILGGLIYATMQGLEVYTNHGESIEVPDLISLRVTDAEKLLVQVEEEDERNKLVYFTIRSDII